MVNPLSNFIKIYRALAQNMRNISVLIFDADTRYVLAEGVFLKYSLPNLETIVGKLPHEVLPPDRLSVLLPIYERILSGESFSFEGRTADFAYQSHSSPIKDDNEQVIGGLILTHDVSEFKRAEATFHATEARYQSLVNLAPVGIIQTNLEGNRVFCNTRWCEMTGLTLEQALRDDNYRSIHADDRELANGTWEQMMEDHLPFDNLIFRYQRLDGTSLWVSGNGTPLYNQEGVVTGYLGTVTDIDTQIRGQAALNESEARYRSVIATMSEGIVLQGQDGVIQACNPAAEQILGLTADQMIGLTSLDPLWQAIHEDGSPFPGETHPAIVTLRTGEPQSNVVMGVYKPDDSLRWVNVNSRPIFTNGNPLPSAVVVTFIDITGIRSAHESLQREHDLLRTLIDNTPDYIFLKDVEGRFILSNIAHAQAAGKLTTEEIVGKTAFDLFLPDLAFQFYADDQKLMHSGQSLINAERETVDAQGNHKTVLTTKIPWRDSKGEVLGLIGISRDITKRKDLEDKLRHNERHLRLITDNIQDIVIQTDVEGHVIFVSESCRTVLGYEPEAMLGKLRFDYVHDDDRIKLLTEIQRGLESGVPYITQETRLRHHEGHYIQVETIVTFLFGPQSTYNGLIFSSRDITERKRLQEMTIEQERLHAALEKELELGTVKTRMMQRIAHEFRTPLTIIQASIGTLTGYLDRLTPAQRNDKFDMVARQILSITDMLDQISIVINGSFKPDRLYRDATDVSSVCRQAAVELEAQLNQPGKFDLELPQKLMILADVIVLKTAIVHVMRNAARFSQAASVVKISLTEHGRGIELRVIDCGIGILPNEQPHIFEPFFRGSNINEVGGLGVGLTIAHAAIEAHDGTLTVESVPKQGTTVTIRLP